MLPGRRSPSTDSRRRILEPPTLSHLKTLELLLPFTSTCKQQREAAFRLKSLRLFGPLV